MRADVPLLPVRPGPTRRRFLGAAAAGLAAAGAGAAFGNRAVGPADLVVRAGTLHTMEPTLAGAEAFAVRGGRFLAVGSWADVRRLTGPATRLLDVRNGTVTPGFIDAHAHVGYWVAAYGVNMGVRSLETLKRRLAAHADRLPEGALVVGYMYDDTKFVEGRPLVRDDIDAVVPEHPVIVRHRGGHTVVVNSRTFELAGVTDATPDPEGGRFFREGGRLTGKVAEKAVGVIETALARLGLEPRVDRDTRRRALGVTLSEMAAAGLTSTTDAASDLDVWTAAQDALARGELPIRLGIMPRWGGDLYRQLTDLGLRSGQGNAMVRLGATKFFADGSASERTMRMSEPYEGTDDYGILTASQEQIDEVVDDALAHGFRVGIHANGDVAIDMVLQAYERALAGWRGADPRLRIEHCSLVDDDLLSRIKATGTIPAPFYTYAHYHGNKWSAYGTERMERMFAHRSFLEYGIPVAPASDYMPGPFEPMMALQSMVTRKDLQGRVWGPSQRITVAQAMRICTVHGAYASFEEHDKGSIRPGKLADFVVLGANPVTTDPDGLREIPVLATYRDGTAVHEA